MYFFSSKIQNSQIFYTIKITTFYLQNTPNISFWLSKMKQESLNLRPKFPYLGIFRLTFEKKKTIVTFEELKLKLQKFKILKFVTKIVLFGCFGQQI